VQENKWPLQRLEARGGPGNNNPLYLDILYADCGPAFAYIYRGFS